MKVNGIFIPIEKDKTCFHTHYPSSLMHKWFFLPYDKRQSRPQIVSPSNNWTPTCNLRYENHRHAHVSMLPWIWPSQVIRGYITDLLETLYSKNTRRTGGELILTNSRVILISKFPGIFIILCSILVCLFFLHYESQIFPRFTTRLKQN